MYNQLRLYIHESRDLATARAIFQDLTICTVTTEGRRRAQHFRFEGSKRRAREGDGTLYMTRTEARRQGPAL
jgi:hypothetical protein